MAPGGVDFYLHPDPVVRLRRRHRRKRRHRQKGTLFRNFLKSNFFYKVLLSHMNVDTQSIANHSVNSSYVHQHYNTHEVTQSLHGDTFNQWHTLVG